MKSNVDKDRLMAYLYGELSEQHKKEVEQGLKDSPELLAELESLKEVRSFLGEVDDVETVDPYFFSVQESLSWWQASRVVGNYILKPAIGLAAAISLIILLAYATNLSLASNDTGFQLSFGGNVKDTSMDDTKSGEAEPLDREQVSSLVGEIFKEKEDEYMLVVSQKLEDQLEDNSRRLDKLVEENSEKNLDLVTTYLTQLRQENEQALTALVENSNASQQQYLKTVLSDFYEFLDEQREEDLRAIQYHLTNLKETQNSQEIETKEIIASLASRVGARTDFVNE